MHKLIEFICNELEELERKAEKDKSLSMAEVQYGDLLAHFKKNILKADEMWEDSEYAMGEGGSYEGMYRGSYARGNQGGNRGGNHMGGGRGGSYARGRGGRNTRRDSMGRYSSEGYSRAGDEIVAELREMMEDAPDDRTRQELERFIQKMEQM